MIYAMSDTGLISNLEIASDLSELVGVERLINDVCVHLGLEEEYYGNILIAVTEAVNNAIIHGNKNDKNKRVLISAYESDLEFWFLIKDDGRGFDFTNLPDPTSPENILLENGRGIFLMNNLADKIDFLSGGSEVKVVFSK
jgi:serine/threonine-protein kinase RsbW